MARSSTLALGPWKVEVDQEMITLPPDPRPVPDESWRFMDAARHGHFWRGGSYPTLEWVQLPCTMGHDDDCDSEGFYRCPHCDEAISPGMKPGSLFSQSIAGPIQVTATYTGSRETRMYVLRGPDAEAVMTDPVEALPRVTSGMQPTQVEWTAF